MRKALAGLALILAGCSSTGNWIEKPRRTAEEMRAETPATAPEAKTQETTAKPPETAPESKYETISFEITYKIAPVATGFIEGYFQKNGIKDDVSKIMQLIKFDKDGNGTVSWEEAEPDTKGVKFYHKGKAEVSYKGQVQAEKGATLDGLSRENKMTLYQASKEEPVTKQDIEDLK